MCYIVFPLDLETDQKAKGRGTQVDTTTTFPTNNIDNKLTRKNQVLRIYFTGYSLYIIQTNSYNLLISSLSKMGTIKRAFQPNIPKNVTFRRSKATFAAP